jgi:hypothetical protein
MKYSSTGAFDFALEFVDRARARFIPRFGSAESKGSGQLELGAVAFAAVIRAPRAICPVAPNMKF